MLAIRGLHQMMLALVVPAAFSLACWNAAGQGAVFTNVSVAIPAVQQGVMAWADYNNDGLLDILIAGNTNYQYGGLMSVAQVWRNAGGGNFTNIAVGLPGLSDCAVAWADFDNDAYAPPRLSRATGSP